MFKKIWKVIFYNLCIYYKMSISTQQSIFLKILASVTKWLLCRANELSQLAYMNMFYCYREYRSMYYTVT